MQVLRVYVTVAIEPFCDKKVDLFGILVRQTTEPHGSDCDLVARLLCKYLKQRTTHDAGLREVREGALWLLL